MVDNKQQFAGVFSAIVTPMHHDESVNYEALALLAKKQLSRGVEGFYCCGSSGEGPLLNIEERSQIAETIVKAVDDQVPVIAHVGTVRTLDAVKIAKNAEKSGVKAVSLVPPYYYNFSQKEIINYYKTVLSAVSIPVILYNIPQFTKVEFDRKFAGELLSEQQVLGVKHTSHNMYSLQRMVCEYPDKIFYNGFDEIYFSSLAAGVKGTIGTTVNIQPELFLKIRQYYHSGQVDKAQKVQGMINYAIEYMVDRGIFQSAKYMSGIDFMDLGNTRAPFELLSEEYKKQLDNLNLIIKENIANETKG